MTQDRSRRRLPARLVPAAALLAALAGCGGDQPDLGGAVVVPEPGTTPSAAGSTETTAPESGGMTASPAQPSADVGAARVAEGFGTLRGRVIFTGEPPQRVVKVPQGKAPKDPQVCAADEPILANRLVVNPENKGVRFAIVYLAKPSAISPEATEAARAAEVVFDQENCEFVPHVLAVMQGSTVTIKSSDPVNHNVNASLGSFSMNQAFSPNDSRTVEVNAATRSPGPVVCDVHPWMKAYWMICDNPYFAVTDEDGEFVIENVPAGTQSLLVWHEATDYLTDRRGDPVDVKADDEVSVEFSIDPGSVRAE